MTKGKSVLIVGAGHNGLICGTYLARAGHKVTMLEARDTVGGGIAMRQFSDGFSVPALAQMHHPLHAKIVSELKLASPSPTPAPMETISLSPTGAHVTLGAEQVSGRELNEKDRAAYSEFMKEYASYAKALGALYLNTPPRLKDFDLADARTLTKLGLKLRFGLGRKDMREFLRVGGMNIYDILNEVFNSEPLKGALAVQAVLGNHVGPRTPTTALNYLYSRHQELNGAPVLVSGTAGSLETAAAAAGVDIKTNAAVKKIKVENGRATGVELASGEHIKADLVVSNADAKTTFLDLVGASELDAMFVHRISKTRTYGDVSKIHIALKAPPVFAGLETADLRHRLLIAPSMRYVERAFNPSKYGEYSEDPVLDISIPSMNDPSLAPQGHHVMCINVSYTPYRLKAGWEQNRDALYQTVIDTLSAYAPGIADRIEDHEILTPVDIEREYGVTGGHWHHGEMSIDQGFMMRPVHGTAQYQTPVEGLFLCGAAAHPGGGITGLPGRNAARRILAKGGV